MVFFSSDFHLGHRAIPKYRTRFKDAKEHDEYILQKMEALGKRDILYVIGDFLFDGPHYEEYIQRIRKMKCRVKLVMGNHDSLELYKEINQKPQSPEGSIEIQLPLFSYKNHWIGHAPIIASELRGRKGQIHGHMHLETLADRRYFNVNLDVNDYEFVPFEDIKAYFNKELSIWEKFKQYLRELTW